jgi:hypothetical protein
MKLVYLVHDLADPAVERRVRMLRIGGVAPALIGFHRGKKAVAAVDGIQATDLGQTIDARLGQRLWAVARTALRLHHLRASWAGASMIVARNLEMLLLAVLARRRFAPDAAVAYESLDIHSSLVGSGLKSRVLRAVEQRLLQQCQLLITSSPAFVARHFAARYAVVPQILLLENKLLASELRSAVQRAPLPGPPWRIGWFGVIRCRRSLELLAGLVRACPGLVEVEIRGRPARNVIPDFDAIVASTAGLRFLGAYDRTQDLAMMYGGVHFAWAMDFYEAGANSSWLLPNRLYEGGAYGAVHLALDTVETGRWLAARHAGIVLEEPLAEKLSSFFTALTPEAYASARSALTRLPVTDFVSDSAEVANLVATLAAVSSSTKFRNSR